MTKRHHRPSCGIARTFVAVTLLALPLLGCSYREDAEEDPFVHPVLSPSGEPLTGAGLGVKSCAEALEAWRMKWGRLDLPAYLADARAQFQAMDLDRDGVVTSAELSEQRAAHRVQPKEEEERRARRRAAARGPTRAQGADPVMSADANLDFRVTPDEFLAYAQRRFRALDANSDGVLDRAEIASLCARPR